MALAERESEYGARRGAADARQSGDRLDGRRKPAAVIVADDLRRLMQVACAGVIAEPGPVLQHLVQPCIGEADHVGKPVHEALEIRDHGLHLRLLQHDLRDPDAIGVAVFCHGRSLRP